MKKITAIIPARGGSVGIPRKNIVLIDKHPLIAYSIIACKLSKKIDRIIVSTEDREIADISKKYGAEVPFMRPPEYSKNSSRDIEFLEHFFENVDVNEVALIRPTTPLRDPFVMDAAVDTYFEKKDDITGLRSFNRTEITPYKLFGVKDNLCHGFFDHYNGIKDYSNYPRQFFPDCYEANGHIDIVKKDTIQDGSTFGNKIYAFTVDEIVDIDAPFDLEILKLQIKTNKDLLTKHLEECENG